MNRETNVQTALKHRRLSEYCKSIEIFAALAEESPKDAWLQYQCAWGFDLLGKEASAVPFYERALAGELASEDRQGAFVGLGSTYRTLGQYEEAKATLEQGMKEYPNDFAMMVFHAMTSYNLKAHEQAFSELLHCLLETSADENIKAYKPALEFYRHRLHEVWEG